MGVVFGCLKKECPAVGVVVFGRRGGSGEGRFDTLRVGQFERAVDFVGGDVVEEFAFVFFRE